MSPEDPNPADSAPSSTQSGQDAAPDAAATSLGELVGEWASVPEVAERWDMPVTRVHNLVKERRLLAARFGERAVRGVPSLFLTERGPLEPLHGTAVVLHDSGYSEEDAIRWLFTEDDSLPGRPIDALRSGRKTEIRRRAQALAW